MAAGWEASRSSHRRLPITASARENYGYCAGFWTNRRSGPAVRMRTAAGMPADSYFARGSQGQYVIIIPSRRLVIVRMGIAYTHYGDIDAVERLVREVTAAVKTPRG